MLTALASGVLLGFPAGLSPGPMLALVVAQTLRHGSREGCKIALTPRVTTAGVGDQAPAKQRALAQPDSKRTG